MLWLWEKFGIDKIYHFCVWEVDSRPPQQEKRAQNEHSVLGSVHQQRQ